MSKKKILISIGVALLASILVYIATVIPEVIKGKKRKEEMKKYVIERMEKLKEEDYFILEKFRENTRSEIENYTQKTEEFADDITDLGSTIKLALKMGADGINKSQTMEEYIENKYNEKIGLNEFEIEEIVKRNFTFFTDEIQKNLNNANSDIIGKFGESNLSDVEIKNLEQETGYKFDGSLTEIGEDTVKTALKDIVLGEIIMMAVQSTITPIVAGTAIGSVAPGVGTVIGGGIGIVVSIYLSEKNKDKIIEETNLTIMSIAKNVSSSVYNEAKKGLEEYHKKIIKNK